mmetsp:Transcript_13997/g.25868  ORF Transcript_13997/g.25868 Transcript_13997/m.25868 type:complete len:147 (+) Transcript_13997:71-511(+)
MVRRTASLLRGLIFSLAVLLIAKEAFVAGPSARGVRGDRLQRAAVEEEKKTDASFKLPGMPKKPDMRITNDLVGVGQTYDQDRRGNVWDDAQGLRRSENDDPLPAQLFIPFWVIFSLGCAVLLAVQAGNDDNFGGAIGDGSVRYGL